MKKIFIRSPYFVQVNSPIGGKVELYFYSKGQSVPTEPTYTLTKKIPSTNQPLLTFNISNYAKEFINPINANSVSVPTAETSNTFCYVQVKGYEETSTGFEKISDEVIVCLNGFSAYADGFNYSTTDAVVPLFDTSIDRQLFSGEYVNCYIDDFEGNSLQWQNLLGDLDFEPNGNVYKLPLTKGINELYNDNTTTTYFSITADNVCEPKYTPMQCTFINRFGGWEYLTFFKASYLSTEVTKEDFNLLPSSVNYNVLKGQKQRFNLQGKNKVKVNTGWVDENYYDLIEDLMLSKTVLLDDKPVVVRTASSEKKQYVKEAVINYTIEFDYNYGIINDVI